MEKRKGRLVIAAAMMSRPAVKRASSRAASLIRCFSDRVIVVLVMRLHGVIQTSGYMLRMPPILAHLRSFLEG